MPQIIESYIRQPSPLQDWLEVLEDQAIDIHWLSKLGDEDEIYSFRLLAIVVEATGTDSVSAWPRLYADNGTVHRKQTEASRCGE
jgi:hypothetical protein